MNKKLLLFAISGILAIVSANGQGGTAKKADNQFDDYAYANAIENYERLVKEGYTDEEIYKNLGDANYLNARYEDASAWYSKLFMVEGVTVDSDYMFRYANSLKSTMEYEASDLWMQRYSAANSNEVRARIFMSSPDYRSRIEEQSGRYDIENLPFNSAQSDFAPSFNGEQLVFSTARDSGSVVKRIHQWNNRSFLNLYATNASASGEFTTSEKLSNGLNAKTHESSTAFTTDGTMVYFTRNNSENGGFSRDDEGVSRLKIFRALLKDGKWTNISELPFNGDDFSCAHPTLSPNGDKLYFASDMPGTIGQSDIFVVDLNSDGTIGPPMNLGEKINTEGRETFPFVTEKNVLYFSSDGQQGLGGLDVFATKLEDTANAYVVNVGKPINSADDDFAFIIKEGKGFFSSNRDGGKGEDDIYGFTENEKINLDCQTAVTGIVRNRESGSPLAGAKVAIYNGDVQVSETVSENDGSFSLEGDCKEGQYKLVASKDDYNEGDEIFAVIGATDTEGIDIALEKSIKRAVPGIDLVQFLNLRPVYFDLNKAEIRPDASRTLLAVIEYIKQFPDIRIQVQSHTDSKAGAAYNMALSQKRAENTVTYLLANGVQEGTVTAEGFGETKLINDCTTRESCPDERHQENRRSEFVVME
ncbi:flagellar motor protein MotB [Aggregatimonas sangjinii]|uniref:Flagellar motor protein MotB n=1 Tax=Aggregatimonas sangjinii TaxID=2583587 RepID=A0A5B7SRS3_9FLAO|nr:OmpA family protein [Aggregatimonas sangjinii]QCW99343.1 flagellar motor protein MotB [Aggregatimonas sangjinii]